MGSDLRRLFFVAAEPTYGEPAKREGMAFCCSRAATFGEPMSREGETMMREAGNR